MHVPEGRDSYSTRVDACATLGAFVDVTAGIDARTGVATWTFTTIDPKTLDQLSDPLGRLPAPDKTAPQGEGYVAYTVRARAGAGTGLVIPAKATIVFDRNAPLDTATISNAIDAGPPASRVLPLPATSTTLSFPVRWSGADDPGGSGIAAYDVFVSTDGVPFVPCLRNTTSTSAFFNGANGHAYGFFSVATDTVGHRQAVPGVAQAA